MKKRNIIRVELPDDLYLKAKKEVKKNYELTLSSLVRIALKHYLK